MSRYWGCEKSQGLARRSGSYGGTTSGGIDKFLLRLSREIFGRNWLNPHWSRLWSTCVRCACFRSKKLWKASDEGFLSFLTVSLVRIFAMFITREGRYVGHFFLVKTAILIGKRLPFGCTEANCLNVWATNKQYIWRYKEKNHVFFKF